MFGNGRCRIFNGVCESPRLFAHDASAATSPNKKIMICSRDEQQSEACTLRARREGLVAKPGSSVVALDDPVREEQVLEESVMHKDNARSPQAEPVRTRIPDGLKFSPFSSRRKIPSNAKSEGGENKNKKIPSVSAVGSVHQWPLPPVSLPALPCRSPFQISPLLAPSRSALLALV